ncbi:MAG: malic enzyme-like NAD(P)-binding protein [Andreesenia angusta]|nr:malic enzyme-like NAD(P)-binding protein [Andreesenia angusta]
MDLRRRALEIHEEKKGKIEINSRVKINTKEDLSLAYTPGVAEPCKEIKEDRDKVYKYTSKGNTVAVVTDGTAVLGLGDIGVEASLPVMEGKAILFKEFAGIDSFPICINSKDIDTIVETVKLISANFGGINLEDISAPRCFEIERRLKEELDIPVFHDDQHGTAIVVLAGLINSCKIIDKDIKDLNIVIAGAGAAGIAISKLLINLGIKNIYICDSKGAIYKEREDLNGIKKEMAEITNPDSQRGQLKDIISNKDVFIGVSAPDILNYKDIEKMNEDAIVFALSNPNPEIDPLEAKKGKARIIATGRSDYPNQINNVLAFPGIFRGALDIRAEEITEEMKIESAIAIAEIIEEEDLNEQNIIPDSFNKDIAIKVAEAVKRLYENGRK